MLLILAKKISEECQGLFRGKNNFFFENNFFDKKHFFKTTVNPLRKNPLMGNWTLLLVGLEIW